MNTPSYYIIPDIRRYKESEGAERERLARRIATVIDDAAVLHAVLGLAPAEFADFYPADTPQLSTLDTIDSFLNQFGGPTTGQRSDELVIAPAIDYAAQVLDAPQPVTPPAERQDVAPAEPILSLSLVKIMVKNHNYRKAFEIIEAMSLKNPEKSIYFADQMRYLKKLIALSDMQEAAD